ncbi:hypothetical protein, partial [Novacetimonas pomaceti]|uniref:hypothetical protein n=1 Tax=Novacetimonas pomaceti TaxID=2021998 RepID=UPI00197DE36F
FHFRPLGIRQHKAIHTDFESHPDAFKKHNSQQNLEKDNKSFWASPFFKKVTSFEAFYKKLHQKLFIILACYRYFLLK